MAVSVSVREYAGGVVAGLGGEADVGDALRIARADPDRYPLLSGIDEYDDTVFTQVQSRRLTRELAALDAVCDDAGVRAGVQALLELLRLMEPMPERPPHRRLLFSGD
jgi:hypothetical protein